MDCRAKQTGDIQHLLPALIFMYFSSAGSDPYKDTVGPGIYGGVVKRDNTGRVVIGIQDQNHNTVPGPEYNGGGYTPINKALRHPTKVLSLLAKYPDLVNDISTGGAQPLHCCGMSRRNQHSVAVLVSHGADIEAVDTYGYTPLQRMASNNLGQGALALLEAGADPCQKGKAGLTPMQIALLSGATDVVCALQDWGMRRKETGIERIVVDGAGGADVNGEYFAMDAQEIPHGFDLDVQEMWQRLNNGKTWFKAQNEAYIFFNSLDKHWWIYAPNGEEVLKASAPAWAPPQFGWIARDPSCQVPSLVASFRKYKKN